jgi:RNA polymerase sigma-70 factor (ECF subfamily)
MSTEPLVLDPTDADAAADVDPDAHAGGHSALDDAQRLAALVERELDFVWRSLRRLGVPVSVADDATQRVWLVASRKLPEIPSGRERAFLFGTALRVASDVRRKLARQREVSGLDASEPTDPAPRADEILDQREARGLLEEILESMPDELRAVFILYELEEQTAAQIAELLAIPPGTVASRLRRARTAFEQVVKRLKARGQFEGNR